MKYHKHYQVSHYIHVVVMWCWWCRGVRTGGKPSVQ